MARLPTTVTRLAAADGYDLGALEYAPAAPPRAVVVIAGATGVRQRYYARFAAWLADRGLAALTFDYRGIGESRPASLRGFPGRMRDWGQLDLDAALGHAERRWLGVPLLAVGHSVGGQLLGLAPAAARLHRVVTVSSQSGYWRHWPHVTQLGMAAVWFAVFPVVTAAFGVFPGRFGVGEDLPPQVAREWARWGRRPRFFLDDGIPAEGFSRLRAPLLAVSFSDDLYAPKAAVDWLHALYASAALTRQHLRPEDLGMRAMGHFGAFRESAREALWPRIVEFLEAR